MSERYRQHEQARRDFWAQALLNGATKYDPINKGYSHQYHVVYADMLLAEYDEKFPQPIPDERYLQQEAATNETMA